MSTAHGHSGGFAGASMAVATAAPLAKVATVDPTQAFEPRSIDEALQLSKLLVASKLLPRSIATPEAAFAIIATGRELGMTAMQSLRSIHVIEGKPTLSADLIAALVKSRPDICKYFMLVESTATCATYETLRNGDPRPTVMSFTINEAQGAGLTGKDNWRKYPAAMLRARAITALARSVYPDLALGIYDEDELEPVTMGPAQRWTDPEVQDQPQPQPQPAQRATMDGGKLMARWFDLIDQAESGANLNSVANGVSKAHRDGVITDEQKDRVASAVKAKRALISANTGDVTGKEPMFDGQAAADAATEELEREEGID